MGNKVLVAYASRAGSTEEVAQAIGEVLQSGGAVVEVKAVKAVRDVSGYDAIIVGSAIRAGQALPETIKFLETFQTALSALPTAYFVVCLTMGQPTEANCREVAGYVERLRQRFPQIRPLDVGLFAGKLDYARVGFPFNLMLKLMKAPAGDYRDWEAVRAWARQVQSQLLSA